MLAILSLGSNLGHRERYLAQARKFVDLKCGRIKSVSPVYETASWGGIQQADYLNQIVVLDCMLGPFTLFNKLKKIEKILGRKQKGKLMPRTIDIDILYFDQLVLNTNKLTIPHPRLHVRKFNLLPLIDVAPDFNHPVFNKSNKTLFEECSDNSQVKKYLIG